MAELREAIDRDGYVVLRNVVSPERLDGLQQRLLAAYQGSEKFKGGGSFSGHLNCYPGDSARFTLDEVRDAGIVDLVRSVNPAWADRIRATLNFNLPGSVAQHYHMDGLYLEDFLVVNIAVVNTDLVNGAIDVLPGTNSRFYKFWQYAVQRKYRLTTRLEMHAGDVLIRRSTLWHRGMPNLSAVPRPLMSLTFGETSAPEGDPFAAPDVAFYPNWYSTSTLGRLRERVFVTAPITYSSYRFVRSLRGNKGYAAF
jgi:ectoine hydroxylase-related dioxygenase (phytanoyl-CoA dioxygenase family)